jgi:cyclopropane fatty-acyl-phospholipid synthase-like methyltransferase
MIKALLDKNNISFRTMTEVGCGTGGVIQFLAQSFTGKIFTGYDISPQSIAIAQQKVATNNNLHFLNADYLSENNNNADILLVADVIEHVSDYYGFLTALKSKSAQFVFHIPLDLSCRTILKPHILLQQRNDVGHIHYFTEEHVWWMLKDCNYKVKDWQYTKHHIDLEKPENLKQAIKKILRAFSFAIAPKWSVKMWGGYSLLILAE